MTRPYGFSGGSQDNYLCDDSDSASTSILSSKLICHIIVNLYACVCNSLMQAKG